MKKYSLLFKICLGITVGLLAGLLYSEASLDKKENNILFVKNYPQVVQQGEVVLLEVECLKDSVLLEGKFLKKKIYFNKDKKNKYYALLGVDLTLKEGTYDITLRCKKRRKTLLIFHKLEVRKKYFKLQGLNLPEKMVDLKKDTLKVVQRESRRFSRLWQMTGNFKYWEGKFIIPVTGKVRDNFGWRRILNGRKKSLHSGIDIKANLGEKVVASNHGKIALVDDFYLYGKSVVINHGQGLYTMYFHLSEIKVKEGILVKKGELIGLVGSTGRATGPHLHWGVRLNKARVSPLSLVEISANFAGCKQERKSNKFIEASMLGKEKLLEEVEVTAHKYKIDQIKEIAQFVEGVVLNEEYKPVSKISVMLEREDKSFSISHQETDSGGCFTFQKIPYGKYILKLVDREKIIIEQKIKVDKKEKDVGIIYLTSSESKKEIKSLEELEQEVKFWEKEIKDEEKFLVKKEDEKIVKKEEVSSDKSSNKENIKEKKIVKEKEINLSFHPNDITWDGEYFWIISKSFLYKINPLDGAQISKFRIDILDGSGLTWDGKYLWCSDCFVDKLYKIDPKSKQVVDIFYTPDPGDNHYGMAFDGKYLWYSSSNANFYKINPQNGQIIESFLIKIGGCHNSLAWDGRYLWSTIWNRGVLCQIDFSDDQIIREFVLDIKDPSGIVFVEKSMWIASYYQKKIYKLKFE